MAKAYFLLGIHNHQPVGNFPEVFERAYQVAYKPFMEAMERHPSLKWSLHASGVLWDYIFQNHPEYIDSVKKMVAKGNLEILSGGYYEPVLSSIADEDKIGQIKKLNKFVKDTFNYEAKGIWLTERVWEPSLAKEINQAGIKYSIVDDAHFAAAGMDVEKLRGYYITEEAGSCLSIFPISQRLRYYIPFQDVSKTFDYIRSEIKDLPNPAFVMADDGEKFGMSQETHKHVYTDGWFERFLSELEKNSQWLETITFSEYMAKFPVSGRIYLPTASYFEMSEWSLPADAQHHFEKIVKEFTLRPDVTRFLRGGIWRNFLTKYSESNNMHKKMIYLSNLVKSIKDDEKKNAAQNFVYEAQCNCAYWHGVFGGLYLPHLRNAIYAKLLSAEKLLKQSQKHDKLKSLDFDCDGNIEILFEAKEQNLYIAPSMGGAIFEWDFLPSGVNLLNVLTRREEAYHKRLIEHLQNPGRSNEGIKTIHDIVKVKQNDLDKYLNFDWYRRLSLIDHFLVEYARYDEFTQCRYAEQGDFVQGNYAVKLTGNKIVLSRKGKVWQDGKHYEIELQKTIIPSESGFSVNYKVRNLDDMPFKLVFAPEFNFAFSCPIDKEFGEFKGLSTWSRKDIHHKLEVNFNIDSECDFWVFPLETVSLSESGFEKTYQGTCFTPVLKRILEHSSEWTFKLSFVIEEVL